MKYLQANKKPAIKLHTVSVIEMVHGNEVLSVRSFVDNPQGNKRAEKLFSCLVRENDPRVEQEDLDGMIEDGIFADCCGYQVLLVHST